MKKIISIFMCAVLLICVKSECDGPKCATGIVSDILKETSVLEDIDIKLEVPNFKQIKNVGFEDLNQILHHLTNWFENRLNDTNFVFKHVNNKTKIFVKSFDFNVDFENGHAKIDVDLTEESNDQKQETSNKNEEIKTSITAENINTTTAPIITTTENLKQKQIEKSNIKTEEIDRLIEKLENEKNNDIFKLEDLDTSYYDSNEDNSTDYPILDYVEMYKDTTNEELLYIPTTISPAVDDNSTGATESELNLTEDSVIQPTINPDPICHGDPFCKEFTKTVFPWIASIFVTNNQDNQFNYYCDGVLLTEKVIVTDARCMMVGNKTLDPDSLLVFLGKVNLQTFGGNEKVLKAKSIVIHPNFTASGEEGKVSNDLALIMLEEAVELKENIQSACIHQENSIVESATTAWALDGALAPIFFNKEKGEYCFDKDEDIFCVSYGNEVPLCPSYGGVFASLQEDRWCVSGIFYGNPADRGICFTKDVHYTSLSKHLKWIDDTAVFKNDVV